MHDPDAPTPETTPHAPPKRVLRLLVVCPSWVGDVVMATPALRLLRSRLKGAFIGGLMRPGLDELLAGTDFFDEVHVDRARGVMGPKLVAAKIRPRQYDTALLLTNSFSTALITRLAFIPRRIGYDRDHRGLLLTDRIPALRTGPLSSLGIGRFACVSAVDAYLHAARVLAPAREDDPMPRLSLATTPEQDAAAHAVLGKALGAASAAGGSPYCVLNPGANNPAKRWPAELFAEVGVQLARGKGWTILVNGSPAEAELCESIVASIRSAGVGMPLPAASLPAAGITLGALKSIARSAKLMLTNDTGPRHIAAAFGTPTVTLFGPTDPRWTTLPPAPDTRAISIVANPELPAEQLADDHPEECRIDRITVEQVLGAIEQCTR